MSRKKNPIYDIDVYLRPIEKTNKLINKIQHMQEDIKVIRKVGNTNDNRTNKKRWKEKE